MINTQEPSGKPGQAPTTSHSKQWPDTSKQLSGHAGAIHGFSSPSTFREQFRRAAQVTPSEYRATFSGYPPHDNDKTTR